MTAFSFTKAVKQQERLRLALDGPAGGGKTWTGLLVATYLAAKDGGRIAVIDSERGSAKKYASDFDFDHLSLPDNSPHTYIGAIRAAGEAGYTVVMVDSLSHAWEGTLELKDEVTARSRSKDSFSAWREVTPVHNDLVDVMLRLPAHVIVTMRTKTEYLVDPENPDRNKRIQRVGLKPVQRDGVEYEFDVVGDLDIENTLVVTKTRCRALTGAVIRKPDEQFAKVLHDWLNDGEPLADPAEVDALRERLNQLDGPTRSTFRAQFGDPRSLSVSALKDADAWVSEREQPFEGSAPCEFCGSSPCECAPDGATDEEPPAA